MLLEPVTGVRTFMVPFRTIQIVGTSTLVALAFPVAVPFWPVSAFDHVTCEMPPASDAVPVMVSGDDAAGPVRRTSRPTPAPCRPTARPPAATRPG